MTLIITALNKDYVFQVSDRRLTFVKNNKVFLKDDDSNKMICVVCKNSCFSISYTGLAEIYIGRKIVKTDIWIAEYLTEMGAGDMVLMEVIKRLKTKLSELMKPQPFKTEDRGLTLVFGGYCNKLPFICCISNMEDEEGNPQRVKLDFSHWLKMIKETSEKSVGFVVNGVEAVVDSTFWPRIEQKGAKIVKKPSTEIIEELVLMIRWAANDKKFGKYISLNCTSVIVNDNGKFDANYHNPDIKANKFLPHLVFPNISFKDIEIS